MEFTNNRLMHSLSVARKMKEIVSEELGRYECSPEDMFVLGFLHDIGYEFSEEQKNHAHRGGEILKEQGYKYWREIYYHGVMQTEYDSTELRLLNYVDLITDQTGKYVTVQERIGGIAKKYGKASLQVEESTILAKYLKLL